MHDGLGGVDRFIFTAGRYRHHTVLLVLRLQLRVLLHLLLLLDLLERGKAGTGAACRHAIEVAP